MLHDCKVVCPSQQRPSPPPPPPLNIKLQNCIICKITASEFARVPRTYTRLNTGTLGTRLQNCIFNKPLTYLLTQIILLPCHCHTVLTRGSLSVTIQLRVTLRYNVIVCFRMQLIFKMMQR